MDLKHTFTVPASVAETWRTFEDIESVAGCFPGATVTDVAGNDFKGTCKVKLGPIALLYTGSGSFLEKDESGRRFVIEAKGKDKRGNGTAGATVTATFIEEAAASTRVDVRTDLSITGKPAQFGRGVIEDVSNKLLQQFVTCLQDKVGAPAAAAPEPEEEAAPEPAREPAAAAAGSPGTANATVTGSAPQAGTEGDLGPTTPGLGMAGEDLAPTTPPTAQATTPPTATPKAAQGPAEERRSTSPIADENDALDLGATVLPVLARRYGSYALVALLALVVGYLLRRRRG